MIEVTTIADLKKWQRAALIKTLEEKLGSQRGGDAERLRRLFIAAGIIPSRRKDQ
jgi:hypothetical protein